MEFVNTAVFGTVSTESNSLTKLFLTKTTYNVKKMIYRKGEVAFASVLFGTWLGEEFITKLTTSTNFYFLYNRVELTIEELKKITMGEHQKAILFCNLMGLLMAYNPNYLNGAPSENTGAKTYEKILHGVFTQKKIEAIRKRPEIKEALSGTFFPADVYLTNLEYLLL